MCVVCVCLIFVTVFASLGVYHAACYCCTACGALFPSISCGAAVMRVVLQFN